jgi:hypothetical protein
MLYPLSYERSPCRILHGGRSWYGGQAVRWDVWPVPGQGPEHLVEDLISPLGLDQASLADADQQVAKRIGLSTLTS